MKIATDALQATAIAGEQVRVRYQLVRVLEVFLQVCTMLLTCRAKQVANRKRNNRRGPGGCYNCYTWVRGAPSFIASATAMNGWLTITIHALTDMSACIVAAA